MKRRQAHEAGTAKRARPPHDADYRTCGGAVKARQLLWRAIGGKAIVSGSDLFDFIFVCFLFCFLCVWMCGICFVFGKNGNSEADD